MFLVNSISRFFFPRASVFLYLDKKVLKKLKNNFIILYAFLNSNWEKEGRFWFCHLFLRNEHKHERKARRGTSFLSMRVFYNVLAFENENKFRPSFDYDLADIVTRAKRVHLTARNLLHATPDLRHVNLERKRIMQGGKC